MVYIRVEMDGDVREKGIATNRGNHYNRFVFMEERINLRRCKWKWNLILARGC